MDLTGYRHSSWMYRVRASLAQTQHLNHEPQTAWNTLPLNELQYGNFLGHGERLFGVS
jgi:hypothetical protein